MANPITHTCVLCVSEIDSCQSCSFDEEIEGMICDVCMDDIPYNSIDNICETLCEKGYYYIEPIEKPPNQG